MKKTILFITFLTLLSAFFQANTYYNSGYYNISIKSVIDSPNQIDINSIENKIIRHCEQVYLEASRRREYTDLELKYCSDIFEIKKQQELDYITYMLRNRGIY